MPKEKIVSILRLFISSAVVRLDVGLKIEIAGLEGFIVNLIH